MAKTRRARVDAENGHRRVTRPRLRIIVKETRGYPTGHLRAQSGTIGYDRRSREVGYDEAKPLYGLWVVRCRSARPDACVLHRAAAESGAVLDEHGAARQDIERDVGRGGVELGAGR